MKASARQRIIFVSHRTQLEQFAASAPALRRAGFDAELWTADAADRAAGERTGLFSRVVNLAEGYRRGRVTESAAAFGRIHSLERQFGPFFHLDCAIDRSITGFSDAGIEHWRIRDRWSQDDLAHLADALISAVQGEALSGDIAVVVGETNSLPYRMVYRALQGQKVLHLSPTYVPHSDGRMYFEDDLGMHWDECIALYRRYLTGAIPAGEGSWAEAKLREIRERRATIPFVQNRRRGHERATSRLARAGAHVTAWQEARSAAGRSSPRVMPAEILSPGSRLRRLLAAKPREKFYERSVRPTLPPCRFGAFFLHVQPEYAVDCLAFANQDQIALIRNIVSILPADMALVVKDHKFDAGRRSREFYGELGSIPGVWLIDDQFDTITIIRDSEFVATLSGTVALEAMCCQIPAVVFGDVYYRMFEGIVGVDSVSELKSRIWAEGGLPSASTRAAMCALAARHSAAHEADMPWVRISESFPRALLAEISRRQSSVGKNW